MTELETLKSQIDQLEQRKSTVEKNVNNYNAQINAQLQILKSEFGISKVEEIEPLIKQLETEYQSAIKTHNENVSKVTEQISKLEKLLEQ